MAQRRGQEAEMYLHHRDGHRVPVHVRCQPIRDPDGTVVGAVEIFNEDSAYRDAVSRIATLEQLSSTDALTELPNRRTAELSLHSRLHDVKEAGWPLGLLFADIDFFKRFNDEHGHAIGDEVLQVVGRSLRAGLRESDLAARWGGEEFVVLTAATDREQVETLGQRLRSLVAASSISVGDEQLSVTLSMGGTLADRSDTIETLVERADAAMYTSKSNGRDQLTFMASSTDSC
jgi:diguanylate cyclase (GGDEF)-like protein